MCAGTAQREDDVVLNQIAEPKSTLHSKWPFCVTLPGVGSEIGESTHFPLPQFYFKIIDELSARRCRRTRLLSLTPSRCPINSPIPLLLMQPLEFLLPSSGESHFSVRFLRNRRKKLQIYLFSIVSEETNTTLHFKGIYCGRRLYHWDRSWPVFMSFK